MQTFSLRLQRPLLTLGVVALATSAATSASAQDFIVTSGTTSIYNTDISGRLIAGKVEIQEDASLIVIGARPFSVLAAEVIIDGVLDASGQDSAGVGTLNMTSVPEPGAMGTAGGGRGGMGSSMTTQSTPKGSDGFGAYNLNAGVAFGGGGGGESSYSALGLGARRAAGGGGGALGADQPVVLGDPLNPANIGLVSNPGFTGAPNGTSAVSGVGQAIGGAAGNSIFQDGDPNNNFWGRQLIGPSVRMGEVSRPEPGRGGGGGGDAVDSATFPLTPFSPFGDEKGAGGGGGGGLVAIVARRITLGERGQILANGGDGGGGENTFFFDRIGGGSGAGSGGWIILDALDFDFSEAQPDAIQAYGGRGGVGISNLHDNMGSGGNGGPGVIQLHTTSGLPLEIQLGAVVSLELLATPNPVILLPALRP